MYISQMDCKAAANRPAALLRANHECSGQVSTWSCSPTATRSNVGFRREVDGRGLGVRRGLSVCVYGCHGKDTLRQEKTVVR